MGSVLCFFQRTVISDAKEGNVMKKIIFLSALAILLCFTPAMAKEGPYLGFGLLYNNPLSSDFNYLDPAIGLDLKFGYNFGPVAVELNLMGSEHDETAPGLGTADFGGFSLDFRFFLSPYNDPNQFYFLAGFGAYSLDGFDPYVGADVKYTGGGFNFGAGLEHYLNENVALNFGIIYRIIRFDEAEFNGFTASVSPELKDNTLSVEIGLNFHF
jgi:opacity protein-like surface antigen